MSEEGRNRERRSLLGDIGEIVESLDKTVRQAVEKSTTGAETLGENLRETIMGMRAGRENVVMVRIDGDSNAKIDALVDTGLVRSRSEGGAFLIAEGIKARSKLFDTIVEKVEDIRKRREELQRLLEGDFDPTATSAESTENPQ